MNGDKKPAAKKAAATRTTTNNGGGDNGGNGGFAVLFNHNGWNNPMGWLALLLLGAMIAGVATLVVLAINGNLNGGNGPASLDAHNSVNIGVDGDSDKKDCNQCATPTASPAETPLAVAPISAPAPIVIWNGGGESGGNETTTVNSSSNSSSSVSVVVPSEPIAPQPPANPTPIVVPPVVNPTPVPQPAATCRVIHDYQLQDLTEVATSGSHIHVEYWTDGQPERETMLPARDADGGRFILTQPLRGHVWEYADCSDDQVMSQINAHIQRRLAGHANNAGFVQWTTTGLFQPS